MLMLVEFNYQITLQLICSINVFINVSISVSFALLILKPNLSCKCIQTFNGTYV